MKSATSRRMKLLWLGCLLLSPLIAGSQDSEFNINTRYTIENIMVAGDGWTTSIVSDHDTHISSSLRKDITSLIGQKLSPSALDDLGRKLRKEFRARTVEHRVIRGKNQDYVQVIFDIKLRPTRFDLSVPKFLYATNQSGSGEVEATASVKEHAFTVGLVSDGDELAERFTGIETRYENNHVGSDRVRFRFEYDSFHDVWNSNSLLAGGNTGFYRTRDNFEPVLTVKVARPLSISFGTSFERMQDETSDTRFLSANAVIASAKYHHRIEGDLNQQDFDGLYDLRAGVHALASDFGYNRHRWEFRYTWSRGKQMLMDEVTGGVLTGHAPLYERFVLGNSTTLRGWNKYDIDPLGGNRMVHNSVDYRYGAFEVFYDSGAVWDSGESAVARNSVGVGIREGVFSVAMAFPLREGKVEPVFMVGMNY